MPVWGIVNGKAVSFALRLALCMQDMKQKQNMENVGNIKQVRQHLWNDQQLTFQMKSP